VAFAITPDAAGRVNAKRNRGKLKIDQFPGNGQVWAVPNFNVKELANNLVRQAMAYAVPYKDIIDKVYYGRATIAKTLFYSYMPCRQDKYWHYDTNVAKAKQLMEQAGYKNGIGPVDLLYPIERPLMALVATVLQQAWGNIGIKINLVPTPETVAQSRLNTKHDIPIYLSDTLSVVNPAVPGFTQFFTTGAVTNLANYPNQGPQDALHKVATSTLNMKVECQVADQFQQIFERDLPLMPLVGFNDLYLMGSHVQGFSWYPDKSTRFATAFWK
jgi:peptide/nickel transport system substrate-binding protein